LFLFVFKKNKKKRLVSTMNRRREHQVVYNDIIEIDDDDIRPCDNVFRDTLMGANRREIRSTIAQEDDVHMRLVMEESLRTFEKEEQDKRRLEQLEQERIREEQAKIQAEINRVKALREKLGMVTTRLRTAFSKDDVAVDLLAWIEWECTPTQDLQSFRPRSKHSIAMIRQWMTKNLNPALVTLLQSSLSCF
jgi:serine phosphatase RsbU (regulator of sigma subunit)